MWDLIVSVPDHCLSFYFTNGHGRVIIQLRAAIFERIRNAQIKAVQTVSISLLSATFSCVLHL